MTSIYPLIFIGIIGVAEAWISVHCRPEFSFRPSYQAPVSPSEKELEWIIDWTPDLSYDTKKRLREVFKDAQTRSQNYKTWESGFESKTRKSYVLYLVVFPALVFFGLFHNNLNGISLITYSATYILSCLLFRKLGVMVRSEREIPDQIPIPSYSSPEEYISSWRKELKRTDNAFSDRIAFIEPMLETMKTYRSVSGVLAFGAILMFLSDYLNLAP